MRSYFLMILLLCPTVAVDAQSEKSSLVGILDAIIVKDMSTSISVPPTDDGLINAGKRAPSAPYPKSTGPNFKVPLHLVQYQFRIQANDIFYVAACVSTRGAKYTSGLVVKGPVQFRVDKDKLFLNHSPKSELRLALIARLREVSKKNNEGREQRSFETLPLFATPKTVPECD